MAKSNLSYARDSGLAEEEDVTAQQTPRLDMSARVTANVSQPTFPCKHGNLSHMYSGPLIQFIGILPPRLSRSQRVSQALHRRLVEAEDPRLSSGSPRNGRSQIRQRCWLGAFDQAIHG